MTNKKTKRKVKLATVKRGRKGEVQHMPRIIAKNGEQTLRGQRCENKKDVTEMLEGLVEAIKAGDFEFVDIDESHEARQKANPGRKASDDRKAQIKIN